MAPKHLALVLAATATAAGAVVGWRLAAEPPPPPAARRTLPTRLVPVRAHDFQFTAPLVECAAEGEVPGLSDIQAAAQRVLDDARAAGALSDVAVYYQDLDRGGAFEIAGAGPFAPASLVKIPVLIAVLAYEEGEPGFMDVLRPFPGGGESRGRQMRRPNVDMIKGRDYTGWRFAEAMIVESDNVALDVLGSLLPREAYASVYADLGITAADLENGRATPRVVGGVFRALYDASYLSPEMSERVLALAARTTFREGLVAGLPPQTKVSHKFGEWSDDVDGQRSHQLHDCGIVYPPSGPYVLCVMTRGPVMDRLPGVIGGVSRAISQAVRAADAG